MSTEITDVFDSAAGERSRIRGVGGPGWAQDTATVLGQIEVGRQDFISLGSARIQVVLSDDLSCPLRSDPPETPENALLELPRCLAPFAGVPAESTGDA